MKITLSLLLNTLSNLWDFFFLLVKEMAKKGDDNLTSILFGYSTIQKKMLFSRLSQFGSQN